MSKAEINQAFFEEYSSDETVRRYVTRTAGHGLSYLLPHVYGRLYLDCIQTTLTDRIGPEGIRVLEYGCGGGMNLIALLRLLKDKGIEIDHGYGTDFSPAMVEASKVEASNQLNGELQARVSFFLARNESLLEDAAAHFGVSQQDVQNRFHFVLGVNTARYCHRLNEAHRSTAQIAALMVPGGISVMIDMNDRFPLFRSRLKGKSVTHDPHETYLPSLEDYARPFHDAGLEILDRRTFCWVPHSAGKAMCLLMRALSPTLQTLFPDRAMRSLVIARKPAGAAR
jgi:SAM-dependent methyltransferase